MQGVAFTFLDGSRAAFLEGDAQLGTEHSGYIHILLEVLVGSGGAGIAVAPLYKLVTVSSNRLHGNTVVLGQIFKFQSGLAGNIPAGEGAANVFVHVVLGGKGLIRIGGCGCLAGTGGTAIAHPGGNVIRIGAAIFSIGPGMSAGVVQNAVESILLQMNIALLIVPVLTVAALIHQQLGDVQELIAVLLAHLHQSQIELIDSLLAHVGVTAVVLRDGRNRGHGHVAVGISCDNLVQRRFVAAGKAVSAHAAVCIVGSHHHDDAAGLHFCQRLGNGIGGAVVLEVDGLVGSELLDTQALHSHHLIQRQKAVLVVTVGVGIAHKDGFVDVGLACVIGLSQNGIAVGGGIKAGIQHSLRRAGRTTGRVLRFVGGVHDDHHRHNGHNQHQCANGQHKSCLLLLGG